MSSDNNWSHYEIYVIESIHRMEDELKGLRTEVKEHMEKEEASNLKTAKDIERLKSRATAWGAASGAVAGGLSGLVRWIYGP